TRVSAKATYRVTKDDLGRTLTARHTITSGPFAGVQRSTSVKVPKAASKVSFSIPKKVKRSQRVKIRVKVSPVAVRATGKVVVYDGKKRIAAKNLKAGHRGVVKITLPKLKKGKHKVTVKYLGNSWVAKASS